MLKLIFWFSISSLAFSTLAQQETIVREKSTIYAEAFGQGLCWSLNYDRLFRTEKRLMNSWTAGLIIVPKSFDFGDGAYFGVPVSYNWILGKKSHHFEFGVGLTLLASSWDYWQDRKNFYAYLNPKIGYRFQRPQGGLFFRATATALIDLFSSSFGQFGGNGPFFSSWSVFNNAAGLDYPVFPWPGLSLGYTFK